MKYTEYKQRKEKVYKQARIATRVILAAYSDIREVDKKIHKEIHGELAYTNIIDEIREVIKNVPTSKQHAEFITGYMEEEVKDLKIPVEMGF